MTRRLEEVRREKREQGKRAERAKNAEQEYSHDSMWGNLRESSSESDGDDDDNDIENDIDHKNDHDIGHKKQNSVTTGAAAAGQGHGKGAGQASETGGGGLSATPPGGQSAVSPPAAIETRGGALQARAGWSCESCTFWNAIEEGGNAEHPRCAVCEAEGPRNAASPWVSA